VFTRLQSAFAGMLDHADQHLARLIAFLETADVRDDTLVIVMSDMARARRRPLGFVNAMGRSISDPNRSGKLRRLDEIGGPDTTAISRMAGRWPPTRRCAATSRTPMAAASAIPSSCHGRNGSRRAASCAISSFMPATSCRHCSTSSASMRHRDRGCPQLEGESFARSIADPAAPSKASPQYFEMFGHRGLWHGGWKAVAYHPPGSPFENDKWELFHLAKDFSETDDLASREPERLANMISRWWRSGEASGAAAR